MIYRLCLALDYAHRFTVHRDISPENVMIMPNATVQLLDFGIAKTIDATVLDHEVPVGRTFYMAPEQLADPASVDARADIFSLGVVFFEMLTGELPTGYIRVRDLRPELPAECDQVIAYALAPREKRCPTARALAKAVKWCYRQSTGGAERDETALPTARGKAEPLPPLPLVKPVVEAPAPDRKKSLVHSSAEREWQEWERGLGTLPERG